MKEHKKVQWFRFFAFLCLTFQKLCKIHIHQRNFIFQAKIQKWWMQKNTKWNNKMENTKKCSLGIIVFDQTQTNKQSPRSSNLIVCLLFPFKIELLFNHWIWSNTNKQFLRSSKMIVSWLFQFKIELLGSHCLWSNTNKQTAPRSSKLIIHWLFLFGIEVVGHLCLWSNTNEQSSSSSQIDNLFIVPF